VPAAFTPQRFGVYTLTARLGRGGQAEVFRARREGAAGFERTVVIKKIIGGHDADPRFIEMFINEAKIAARLTHPNIVQVYELGEHEGEFFIAMEYVKGKDLLRVMRMLAQQSPNDPAMPPLHAAHVAREVCRGLAHAHEHQDESGAPRPIIHRDISPQNIMLSYDGQVKLVDFGIAKALDTMKEETRTGALKGKYAYMAPEQLLTPAPPPAPQSDIFSTGIVLHETLTGKRLFKGQTDMETLDRVKRLRVPPPSRLNPQVAPELDAIVLHALERDGGLRYARAALMARDVDEYLQSQRFSVENMVELMDRLFPQRMREEVTDSLVGSSSYESSASRQSEAATPSGVSRSTSVHAPVPQLGAPGRGWWISSLAMALVALAAAALYPLVRRPSAHAPAALPPQPAATAPQPTPPRVTVPKLPPPPAPPAEATRAVRVSSEPSGAQVWRGPRLLGVTPVTVRVGEAQPLAVTLMHAGFDDLEYNIASADGPSLTLRLTRRRGGPKRAPVAHPARITVPADEPPPPRPPKIAPIDD
jgi:serine/threonine protein kinase